MNVAKPRNNYDFIRLVASCSVIVGHAYVLLAVPGIPVVFQVSVSTLAVEVFFALSGYLVVSSWQNDPNPVRFILKRGLRIVPGLVGVVLITTLVLGPAVTKFSYVEYFSHPLFYLYFRNIVFYIVHALPGVFSNNIYPNAVNGSLWSLPVEVGMYFVVLMVGVLARRYFRLAWALLTVGALGLNYAVFAADSPIVGNMIFYGTDMRSVVQISPFFMVGGFIRMFQRWIPFNQSLSFGVIGLGYLLTKSGSALTGVGLIIAISYIVVSFGSYSTPVLRDFGKYGDMSYGVYLYGFPVAQCFSMYFGNNIPVEAHIVLTVAVSLVLAFASWHLIEARALKFKPSRLPLKAPLWAFGRDIGRVDGQNEIAAISDTRPRGADASIAVLMCTFNGERFLVDQIESILQQTHQNFRIVASDDGSSDGTMAILEGYRARLGNDRFSIRCGPGQGFAANFLSLLCQPDVEADYFAFADQDDIWEPTKLSNAVSLISREPDGVPVVYSSRSRLVDSQNVEIGLSREFCRPTSFRNAIVQSIGGGNTMIVDRRARDLARRAQIRSIASHDWWLYMLVTGAGGKMIFDRVPATRYRQHEGNLVGMNVGWKMRLQRLRMLIGGQFKRWNDANIRALQDNSHLLTPENRRVLEEFSAARRAPLLPRIAGIWRSGAYRQTVLDEIVVFLAILAKRV